MTKSSTNIALQMALQILFQEKSPVLYININLSDVEIVTNIISLKSGVKSENIKSGFLNTGDYEKIVNIMQDIYEAPIHIINCSIEDDEQVIFSISKGLLILIH